MTHPNRKFFELTNNVDDLVDKHLGDPDMQLFYNGQYTDIEGTVNSEAEDQFIDGAIARTIKFYASVAERKLPASLNGSSAAFITRRDPYNPTRRESFRIVSVDRPRSGRVRLILANHAGKLPVKQPERVSDARKNAASTPHR